ncbi:MAG: FtsL-like putative cell division protein [Lepagella sp.]
MSAAAVRKTTKKSGSRKDKNSYSWMNEMRYGRTISIEFFKSNAWLLVIIIAIVISLMGLRYKTKTKMVEIKNLTKELEIAESDKLHEKAAYMSLIRETEMKRMVREKGLPLEFQEQPPYQLIDNNNQNQ